MLFEEFTTGEVLDTKCKEDEWLVGDAFTPRRSSDVSQQDENVVFCQFCQSNRFLKQETIIKQLEWEIKKHKREAEGYKLQMKTVLENNELYMNSNKKLVKENMKLHVENIKLIMQFDNKTKVKEEEGEMMIR